MGALNSLIKITGKAATKSSERALTNAVEKTTTKAITKMAEDFGTEAVSKGVTKALTKGGTSSSKAALSKLVKNASLSGAGKSSLATKSGSTLDGILGKSSGVSLPSAKKKTLRDYRTTIGDIVDETSMQDLADAGVNRKVLGNLKNIANEGAEINNSAFNNNALGVANKSNLPMLNREQYYYDTIGKVGNGNVSYNDIPEYMIGHLSNNVDKTRGNDSILRELFNDNESDLSELYDRYDRLAQANNQNRTLNRADVEMGLGVRNNPQEQSEIEQELADVLFGGKKNINVSSESSGRQNLKVQKPQAVGENVTITDTANTGVGNENALREEIASMRDKIGSTTGGAGMGGNGGGNTTTFASPEDDGFRIKLKNGETTNVRLNAGATGSTRQQRASRSLDDMTAKGMNATNKQYQKIVGKSNSIDGHYKTVAERMRAENIDQANVGAKAQSAVDGREVIKQQKGLLYAEANGVTIDLTGIDNTIGLSATQKRKLSELGLGLDEMLGGSSVVTPTQAEEIYKTLRDYAYNWSDSKDALTKMAGNACEKEAKAVQEIIDKTMDSINVDYKTPLVEFMAQNGEDPAYIRKIAAKTDFKFSDLRKDQSDWIAMSDLAGNKIKEEPTLNFFGVDTGVPNPFTKGAEKAKEKYYEKVAGGAGGSGAGGSSAGTGASGEANNINFTNVPAGNSRLQNILSRGKDVGLVGGGILGGLLLGGGGSGSDTGSAGTLGDMLQAQNAGVGSASTINDPYSQMTIGGYTYDQLEQGYMAALQAGDSPAAKLIQEMIGMLDDKIARYKDQNSSSTANSNSKSAVNVLSQLYSLYGDIKGGTGPIQGNVTNALNTVTGGGYNTEANTYWQVAQGSLGKMIKGMGDTGALSEGDQQRALKMIPNITDTREAAEAKFKALYQILSGAAQV